MNELLASENHDIAVHILIKQLVSCSEFKKHSFSIKKLWAIENFAPELSDYIVDGELADIDYFGES